MSLVALSLAGASLAAGAFGPPAVRADQQATFRATVDLVAVDVQVVDKNGQPIPHLGPEKFEVSMDGRRRKVVSADFVRHDDSSAARLAPREERQFNALGTMGRIFMVAIDVNSFSVGDSRGVVAAATRVIKGLRPDDYVGLFTFPVGSRVAPSTDHRSVIAKLDSVVGAKQSMESSYHLSPSEVVDITSEAAALASQLGRATAVAPLATNPADTGTLRRVQLRECGGQLDQACAANIRLDAESMAYFYEGQATMAMSGLTSLVRDLSIADPAARKTVVLMSGGITSSDRPGGRPNVDDLAKALGRTAAEANTTVYALHIDTTAVQSFSPEKRRSSRSQVSQERESVMLGRMLEIFAGASGGTMMRVMVGSGEGALDRVLLETSSHYLLGVEPMDDDRGRLRELRIKVSQPGVTVRSRQWVAVPKKRT